MSQSLEKGAVVAALRAEIADELERIARATSLARDEATHTESSAENEYDTRALEASYLAAGQGQRMEELKQLASWYAGVTGEDELDTVQLGALVHVEDERGERWLFVAPSGGQRVSVHGRTVAVISPESNLGVALAGLGPEDAAEVDTPTGTLELEILDVR